MQGPPEMVVVRGQEAMMTSPSSSAFHHQSPQLPGPPRQRLPPQRLKENLSLLLSLRPAAVSLSGRSLTSCENLKPRLVKLRPPPPLKLASGLLAAK